MRPRGLSNALTVVAAGSIITAATPTHKHHNHANHFERRVPTKVQTVDVPGPTIIAYEFNGRPISEDEVCKGIKDGSLRWTDKTASPPECSINAASTLQSHYPTITLTTSLSPESKPALLATQASPVIAQKDADNLEVSQTTSALVSSKSSSSSVKSQSQPSASPSYSNLNGQGLEKDFPDGSVDCSDFPSDYGAISVDWAHLGGWTGIQYVTIKGESITHIDTAVPGDEGCKSGAMCSYACPPGYQKSQWPSAQGTVGQSVGGLRCDDNNKLRLTNANLSKKLCIQGTGATMVENKLSNNAAICRTDYPGRSIHSLSLDVKIDRTENEVVPLDTSPQTTSPLTCPDANTYFKHDGSQTTAQYYINNQGVPLQKACIWGSDGTNMGNWAPSFLGVGQDIYGKTFLSIASTADNKPSNYKPLNYSVEIVGDTSGKCKLRAGKYCSGTSYENCNDKGCTVRYLMFVFTHS
ncbi:uncharacterized protein KY384_008283 [Bacidia gigantensis]|uniref:uncharacterized protein n=1 Tax=Bacidia gigantensis TaxID=2732470 RepID=UPI001D04FB88|nr:uncharacterized protein KY384_008283 [Bacidia gigantensis]KAG8526854.1 hypothetical protein KY384_008283 [Bacidia gigantensis]